jgi:hypothetical protein
MLSIFGLASSKPGLFLSGENLIRYVVTSENPWKLVGDFPVSLKYYGHGSWQCGRVSARGSRSILQGFLKVGSKFLPVGTPLLNGGNSAKPNSLQGPAIACQPF